MIELRHLSHGFLRKSLFQDVSLRLLPNERYGIVGANGSGKSTLLRIMAGEMEPDSGEVEIKNDRELFRIGQDHTLNDDVAIIDTAMMGQLKTYQAIARKNFLLQQENPSAKIGAEIVELEEIIHNNEGYRLRSRAETILEGLGIATKDHEQPLKILSGGYKWRVFLAQALVKNPHILMLDEPTNHLDIISIRWLELFLSRYEGLVIVVSHDQRFMDHVCTQILDIDFDTVMSYTGNYTAFQNARRLFLLQKEKEILAQEKDIAKKQAFIDRFRYKASKARQAQSRIKQIERMDIIEPVRSIRIHPRFKFELDEPGAKEIVTVKHLSKSYGEKDIIKDFSFSVKRGDKVAIIGPNGSGKSTLIKALALEFPECQKSIKWGHGAALGYFAQESGSVLKHLDISVLEWLWQFCADKPQSFVQGMLGRVLFTGEDAKKSTKDLSGGELSRLYLASLMIKKPNVLLLDEPTNHLDLESIENLTEALTDYEGTLLVVSHDRSFIDKIAERIMEISNTCINDFLGSYSEFVVSKDRDYLDAVQETRAGKAPKSSTRRIDYEEQKRRRGEFNRLKKSLEKTMEQVDATENSIRIIDEKFADPSLFEKNDFSRVAEMEREKNSLTEKLEDLLKAWEQIEKCLKDLGIESE